MCVETHALSNSNPCKSLTTPESELTPKGKDGTLDGTKMSALSNRMAGMESKRKAVTVDERRNTNKKAKKWRSVLVTTKGESSEGV
jgi:hypothetical protein